MKNTFKKGLILGGLLAIGSVVGLAMSKDGKKLAKEIGDDTQMLIKNLKKNLGNLEDITKKSFNDAVKVVVDEYAEKKELAKKAKDSLVTMLQGHWEDMEKEYKASEAKSKAKSKK